MDAIRRAFASVRQFWEKGAGQKVAIISVATILGICACCSCSTVGIVLLAGTPPKTTGNQGSDVQPTATSTSPIVLAPASATPSTVTPTVVPTATATATAAATASPTPTSPVASTGQPYVGGPYANYTAAYGQPFIQGAGGSEDFWADKAQTIIVIVNPPVSRIVRHMSAVGPDSWSDDQTFSYCSQFLPSGAVAFNTAPPYTDFNSSLGKVIIANFGSGACVVYL